MIIFILVYVYLLTFSLPPVDALTSTYLQYLTFVFTDIAHRNDDCVCICFLGTVCHQFSAYSMVFWRILRKWRITYVSEIITFFKVIAQYYLYLKLHPRGTCLIVFSVSATNYWWLLIRLHVKITCSSGSTYIARICLFRWWTLDHRQFVWSLESVWPCYVSLQW